MTPRNNGWKKNGMTVYVQSLKSGIRINTTRTAQIGRTGLTGVTTGLDTSMNRTGKTQTVGHSTGSSDANLASQPATQNLASGAQSSAPTAADSAVSFDPESLQSTGSTLTNRSTVRRTSGLGSAGALLGTVAILSMFGRSDRLPLNSQS